MFCVYRSIHLYFKISTFIGTITKVKSLLLLSRRKQQTNCNLHINWWPPNINNAPREKPKDMAVCLVLQVVIVTVSTAVDPPSAQLHQPVMTQLQACVT